MTYKRLNLFLAFGVFYTRQFEWWLPGSERDADVCDNNADAAAISLSIPALRSALARLHRSGGFTTKRSATVFATAVHNPVTQASGFSSTADLSCLLKERAPHNPTRVSPQLHWSGISAPHRLGLVLPVLISSAAILVLKA